jgi:hypothetical protein
MMTLKHCSDFAGQAKHDFNCCSMEEEEKKEEQKERKR